MISIGEFISSSVSDVGIAYFRVCADGRTFIGNKRIKPANVHSDALVQVAGKIGCMELVLLDPLTKWADDMFDEKYSLPSIKEVEQYIQKYKHLQGVPSAKEVEEKGVNVNEMIPILLRKIEEQMLYIIELKKEIEELKSKK